MLLVEPQTTNAPAITAPALRPDAVRRGSADDARRLVVLAGNQPVEAGELFTFSGDPRDARWRLEGDFSRVHHLGEAMAAGELRLDGPAGRHTGAAMTGGTITIAGDAGDWLGAEMRGGQIQVTGDAGDLVGAAYRGSPRGMRGGRILVRGSAGNEVGAAMRRGLIAVGGALGELAGYRLRAGTLLALGPAGRRAGAEMVRGTIGLFGETKPQLLPTFRYACDIEPGWLVMLAESIGFDLPRRVSLFGGDLLCGGRGEVLVSAG